MKNKPAQISRRNFLTVSGTAAAVLATQTTTNNAFAASPSGETASPALPTMNTKKHPIGLELYSVRTELARDLPNTLRNVAKIGYEVVEFYAPYYEWSLPYAKTVPSQMD